MSLLKKVLGQDEDDPQEYPKAEFEDSGQTEQEAKHIIQTVEVRGTKDILTVKDHLNEGNIVFLEIPSSSNISAEHILDDIKQTVEQLNGDIAYRTDDEVIATPAGFYISRERQ